MAVGINVAGVLLAIEPDGGVPSLPEMVVDLTDTSGTGFPALTFMSLESAGGWLLRRDVFIQCRRCFANPAVNLCRRCATHLISDMGVDVQCGATGHMADNGGERLYIHTVFQRGGSEGVPQVMETDGLHSPRSSTVWRRLRTAAGSSGESSFNGEGNIHRESIVFL